VSHDTHVDELSFAYAMRHVTRTHKNTQDSIWEHFNQGKALKKVTCTNTNTHTHAHVRALVHTHTHTDKRTHKCTHAHTHAHTHTHTETHTHTHAHTRERAGIISAAPRK